MKKDLITIGELAHMSGVTVRTLQYYDKEGLLKPSSMSSGGRRLYSSKDMIKLHQILSFKYLGFSLDEIKSKLFTLDTPLDVARVLDHQRKAIEEQIAELNETLKAVNSLREEVLATQKVDFSKYAEIIHFVRIGNPGYWIWKYFEDPLRDHIVEQFGDNPEAGLKLYEDYQTLLDEALELKHRGVPPKSEKGTALAKRWWNMILEFTGGDLSLLPLLESFNKAKDNWDNGMAEKQKEIDDYLSALLEGYFSEQGGK